MRQPLTVAQLLAPAICPQCASLPTAVFASRQPACINGRADVDAGPASFLQQATIFYAPDTSNSSALMRLVAQAAACPPDGTRKSSTSSSFYRRGCRSIV